MFRENYHDFLATKMARPKNKGIESIDELNPMLYEFQADIVKWSLRLGKSALFLHSSDMGC